MLDWKTELKKGDVFHLAQSCGRSSWAASFFFFTASLVTRPYLTHPAVINIRRISRYILWGGSSPSFPEVHFQRLCDWPMGLLGMKCRRSFDPDRFFTLRLDFPFITSSHRPSWVPLIETVVTWPLAGSEFHRVGFCICQCLVQRRYTDTFTRRSRRLSFEAFQSAIQIRSCHRSEQ